MRYLTLGAIACLCVGMGSAVQAQTTDPQLMAPINKFIEAFNKGDIAGAAATHATGADLVIIDEVSPFLWRGAQALQTWAADLEADAKKRGITDQKVTVSPATRVERNAREAYVVRDRMAAALQATTALESLGEERVTPFHFRLDRLSHAIAGLRG